MWCSSCQRPVAGQKSTYKVAKPGAAAPSGGAYVGVPSAYHCPSCGLAVRPITAAQRSAAGGGLDGGVVALVVVGALAVALVVAGIGAIIHAVSGGGGP